MGIGASSPGHAAPNAASRHPTPMFIGPLWSGWHSGDIVSPNHQHSPDCQKARLVHLALGLLANGLVIFRETPHFRKKGTIARKT